MKYVPHMGTFFDSIEHAILLAGWQKGVEALITSWVEYRRARIKWEETWEPDGRHRYFHETPSGIRFMIEWVARDNWALGVLWPNDWGHEHISTGSLKDLQEEANQLAKVDGPFGGPPKSPQTSCAVSPGRAWRVAGEVERRFEVLDEDRGAHLHVTRAGILNHHRVFNFDHCKLQAQADSLNTIEPSDLQQWVLVEGKRRPWSHTAMRPLLGYMNLGERELLLVRPNPPTAVILAHTEGRLQTALTIESNCLSDFDITWLDDAPRWPDQQGARGYVEVIAGSAPLRPYTGPPGQNMHRSPPRVAEGAPLPNSSSGAGSPQRPSPPAGVASTSSRPATTPTPPRTAETAHSSDSADRAPRPSAPPVSADVAEVRVDVVTNAETAPPSPQTASPTSPAPTLPSRAAEAVTTSAAEAPAPILSSPPPIAGTAPLRVEETGAPLGNASEPPPPPDPVKSPPPSACAEPRGAEPSELSPPADSPPPSQSTSSATEDVSPELEQPKPRFPLAENPSPADVERHFAEIEAAIPPKLTGAATAVELWQALGQAHRHGALPITGGWIDLVSTLHRRGWLSRLPGDRATRAAFLILESLSPLVRRLHRRRWVLGLDR